MRVGDLVTWRGSDPEEDDIGIITDIGKIKVYIQWFVDPGCSDWWAKNHNCVKVINESR